MNSRVFIVFGLILCYLNLSAKTFVVNNVEYLKNDLTGSIKTIVDKNGKACAVLKISIPEVARFSGDLYGDINKSGNEYILYVSTDAENLKIYPNNSNTLDVDLTAYPCYPYSSKLSYGVQIVAVSDNISGSNMDYLSNDELLKLATNDNAEACYQIGNAYYLGNRGYEVNHKKGKEWIMRAANLGDIMAQCELGKIFLNGDEITSKDFDKAYYWIEKAAKNGNGNAQCLMAIKYCNNLDSISDRNIALSKYWLTQSINNNYPLAYMYLSLVCFKEEKYDEALEYAEKLAYEGDSIGQFLLGSWYGIEDMSFYNLDKSAFWLELAAEAGLPQAQYALGKYYEDLNSNDNKKEDALFWYKEAAKNGDEEAEATLKRMEK